METCFNFLVKIFFPNHSEILLEIKHKSTRGLSLTAGIVFVHNIRTISYFSVWHFTSIYCLEQGQMTAEERNVRPSEYGEMSSKDYVPGAQVPYRVY